MVFNLFVWPAKKLGQTILTIKTIMKTLKNITFLLLLSAGFAQAQNITVQGEKKLNTSFKKYKSFGWMRADKPANQVIVYSYEEFAEPTQAAVSSDMTRKEKKRAKKAGEDVVIYSYYYTIPSIDSTMNRTLVNTVNEEMEGRGYRKDNYNPDLLIAYKIFDRSSQIKGYNAPPTKLSDNQETHQPMDTVTYKLKPGTILITLIDAKTGSAVWEGYASGVARNDDLINDKLKVKEAINLIFKKYEFRGDKYSMN
jgi:hypothetical protein